MLCSFLYLFHTRASSMIQPVYTFVLGKQRFFYKIKKRVYDKGDTCMTLGQKLKRFISNHTETSDHHPVSELKSHYYKSTQTQAFQAVEAVLSRNDSYQVTSVSAERGEISANIRTPKKLFSWRLSFQFVLLKQLSILM